MTGANKTVYLADWVHTGVEAPIEQGAVLVDAAGKIAFVGRAKDLPTGVENTNDVTGAVIVPGLVNAHTHLEFSDLKKPLGHPGIEFTQWISAVVQHRMQQQATPEAALLSKAAAIREGLRQSRACGVTAIGEIATSPLSVEHYRQSLAPAVDGSLNPILVTAFFEQLGTDESVIDQRIDAVKSFFVDCDRGVDSADQTACHGGVIPAISPHAPYSIGDKLFGAVMDESRLTKSTVAMHVAETMAERALVEHKTGPFVDMLKQFGVWRPEAYRDNDSILSILQRLSQAVGAVVVHGNYLMPGEMDFIASKAARMSVVYCPRTHAYFEHDAYPLEALLDRGINVAIGTDSRASNPDLDVVAEMRSIRQRHPTVLDAQILNMATSAGAAALGLPGDWGSLAVGQTAFFSVIDNGGGDEPFHWLQPK